MIVTFWPDLIDSDLSVAVDRDTIIINGDRIDLSLIPDGYRLPASSVKNAFFAGSEYIERIDGEIRLTLLLPVRMESPEEIRNPKDYLSFRVSSGELSLPSAEPKEDVEND